MRVLRANETNPSFKNAFLVNLFALESQKDLEMTKEPPFGTPRGVWTCLLTLSLRTTPFGSFLIYFHFSHFFGHFLLFLEEKTRSIRFCKKFYVKQPYFCGLSALVCYWAANKYSKIGGIFLSLLENSGF